MSKIIARVLLGIYAIANIVFYSYFGFLPVEIVTMNVFFGIVLYSYYKTQSQKT